MHLSFESRKPLDRLEADVVAALEARGFRLAGRTDGRAALRARGRTGRGSVVLEVEDPLPALDRDARAGGPADATTWKIAAYETDRGTTRVSTLRPTHLVDLLGHPEHAARALRVERDLASALDRAARSAAETAR
jgi:hypothetical protein